MSGTSGVGVIVGVGERNSDKNEAGRGVIEGVIVMVGRNVAVRVSVGVTKRVGVKLAVTVGGNAVSVGVALGKGVGVIGKYGW